MRLPSRTIQPTSGTRQP